MKDYWKIKTIWKNIKKYVCRYKKTCIFLLIPILLYGYIFWNRYELEGYLTFPGVAVNTLERTHPEFGKIQIEFEDINVTLENGDVINGLYIDNNAEKTVYYFHGNGGDLTFFYPTIQYIWDLGYNVMAYDYPGYGRSDGFPYTSNILNASEEFFDYISQEKGIQLEDTIVWGYSIGTGVWVEWAKEKEIDKVILFAAYSSRYDLSRQHYKYAIQKFFRMPNTFDSQKNIKDITVPVLLVHWNEDELVVFDQGKKVFESADKDKSFFIEVDKGSHYNTLETGAIKQELLNFFRSGKTSERYIVINKEKEEAWKKLYSILSLDLESDSSMTKYVNPDIPYTEKWYVPEGMEKLDRTYIIDTKWNAQMLPEAKEQFEAMAEAFYEEFWEKIVVVSSYRSYNYQAGIKARWCPDNLCAKAWHSEHQSWLTADLWSASTNAYWQWNPRLMKFFNWLNEHAHTYGFHNTYQKGREVDGYEIEPWHWRYLGVPLATYLKDQDITFGEFYYARKEEK